MKFTHIHESSRFSRSAASLEAATDSFYKRASIVTLTEVGAASRKRAPYEAGWGYYNAQSNASGYDEQGIAWDLDLWQKKWARVTKLSGRWQTATGGTRWPMVAATVFLKHKVSGHTILVSVLHMPNDVSGPTGFRPQGQGFTQRKASYLLAASNWNKYIVDRMRIDKPDIVLISADWNLNFRFSWVRNWVNNNFKQAGLHQNWKHFNERGTYGHGVIDASLARGVSSAGSFVINDVADSTDHTPYMEHFETTAKPRTPLTPGTGTTASTGATGVSSYHGTAWWNFEDYADDTIYQVEQV